MFNILDFIDSPDIRELNKNTVFSPSEQAVIIYHSYERSAEDKISALRFLADNFSEDEFQTERITQFRRKFYYYNNLRNIVSDIADTWQNALNLRYDNNGVVFLAEISDSDHNTIAKKYFSDYSSAFEFISANKTDAPGFIEITRTPVNMDFHGYASYSFSKDMVLYEVDPYEGDYQIPLSEYFMDFTIQMPLPFRTGDILKVVHPYSEPVYGVLDSTYDEKLKRNPDADMHLRLEKYVRDEDFFSWSHVNYLHLQKVSPDELQPEHNYLKLMSDLRRNKLDFMDFLSLYSNGEMDKVADTYDYMWE